MGSRARSPFPVAPSSRLCEICCIWGHSSPNFPMMQKYQNFADAPFYDFYKIVGHYVNNSHTLQLMKVNTVNSYYVQGTEENKELDLGGHQEEVYSGF